MKNHKLPVTDLGDSIDALKGCWLILLGSNQASHDAQKFRAIKLPQAGNRFDFQEMLMLSIISLIRSTSMFSYIDGLFGYVL